MCLQDLNFMSHHGLGYGMDDRGSRVQFLAGAGNFYLYHCVQNGSGALQPPIQWVPGALSMEVKQPGCEADHSPSSSVKVKECVELYLHSPNMPSLCGAQGQLYLHLYHGHVILSLNFNSCTCAITDCEFLGRK
jgi:hypothetical protein